MKTQALTAPKIESVEDARAEGRPALISRVGMLAGAIAMLSAPFGTLATNLDGLFNDFYTYWAASRLLNSGGDPYDVNAILRVLHDGGIPGVPGSGYSYPLFLAELLRPFAWLPPNVAAAIFAALSLAALGVAVALLAASIPRLGPDEAVLFGAICGFVTPVAGSLYFGQANLIVLPLLALAYRRLHPDWMLAGAASVKVYPASGMLATLTGATSVREKLKTVVPAAFVLAALLLISGGAGGLNTKRSWLLGPDPFWSNLSVNGWLSRLALPSPWTKPPLPWLPLEPTLLAISALIVAATLLVLLLARDSSYEGRLALAVWLGVILAPKNSLWNYTPLVLCVAFLWPSMRQRPWLAIAALATGLAIEEQGILNSNRSWLYSTPELTWLSSLALYGALLLGALVAYVLLRERGKEVAVV